MKGEEEVWGRKEVDLEKGRKETQLEDEIRAQLDGLREGGDVEEGKTLIAVAVAVDTKPDVCPCRPRLGNGVGSEERRLLLRPLKDVV